MARWQGSFLVLATGLAIQAGSPGALRPRVALAAGGAVTATPSASPTPTDVPALTANAGAATLLSVGDVDLAPGASVTIPVLIDPRDPVEAYQFTVTYDPALLAAAGVDPSGVGQDCMIENNHTVPGRMLVSGACTLPIEQGGTLLQLRFDVLAGCAETADVAVSDCNLDESTLPCETAPGHAQVTCDAGGHIRYYSGDGPVDAAVVHVDGTSLPDAESDTGGGYVVPDAVPGTWALRPEKTGGFGNGVSALDAAYILQADVGRRTFDDMQRLACDVTGNGSVSALDAARILQFAVGLRSRFEVAEACGSDWAFVPVPGPAEGQVVQEPLISGGRCQPGAISFDPFGAPVANQDFRAVLFGDCTGNWSSGAGGGAAAAASEGTGVRVGRARRISGGRLRVPIEVRTGASAQALSLEVAYDPALLDLRGVRGRNGAAHAMVRFRADPSGNAAIALASADPFEGGRVMLLLDFAARGRDAARDPVRVTESRRKRQAIRGLGG